MTRAGVDATRLAAVGARLGDAVIDPAIWPDVMDEISAAVGAAGAGLLQTDVRTPDIPRSAGVSDVFNAYFVDGWHVRDVRAERGVPLLLRGEKVVIDQDILTPEEIRGYPFYQDHLAPHGFQWFAAVGFRAGAALWAMSIQRTRREGPFDRHHKTALTALSQRLTETASLSKAVGRAVLSGMTNALDLVRQPALALDRFGFVLDANDAAEQIFDDEFRVCERRLRTRDRFATAHLDDLCDQLRAMPDTAELPVTPIIVQRRAKRPLVIRVLPVDGAARSPFLGARALLLVSDFSRWSRPRADMLARTFGLSPAEARLTSVMASGASLDRAAEELGIARETARNQLKAVFAKTDTHRQSELVALLARL